MKFELVVSYSSDDDEDVQINLVTADSGGQDRTLAVALAHCIFNLNQGTYKELCQQAISRYALENKRQDLAHLILDEWQKMVLHNDNMPLVTADEASKIGQIY
jgi:galactose mutarotase-like enzyme